MSTGLTQITRMHTRYNSSSHTGTQTRQALESKCLNYACTLFSLGYPLKIDIEYIVPTALVLEQCAFSATDSGTLVLRDFKEMPIIYEGFLGPSHTTNCLPITL